MKIGIISINMFSKGLNFACPLHNYAFQQFLLKNGIESQIITYKPIYYNDFDLRHPCEYYEKLCDRFQDDGRHERETKEWKRLTRLRDSWKELYQEREIRHDKFERFIESHYNKTEECYDSDLLETKDPGFDCYICCTDVIWKKEPKAGFDRGFFLGSKAMDNKWKISYAASRGVYFCENKEDENTFFSYVRDIDAISVREESLKEYINDNIENVVTRVVDPVLLHDKEFYDDILVKPKEEHYIFLYYVMEKAEDTIAQAVQYARTHKLRIVETTDRPLKKGSLSAHDDIEVIYNYSIGIEEWLGYIRYADCIFTNSFHASCFSILFEKQFYVGFRKGDKVTQLLDLFGLSGRRINAESDLVTESLPDIDYTVIRSVLIEKRKKSEDFILSSVFDMKNNKKQMRDYDDKRRGITYKITYKSGIYQDVGSGAYDSLAGKTVQLQTGEWKWSQQEPIKNDGSGRFRTNKFCRKGYVPDGWKLCFKIDKKWFWFLENDNLVAVGEYNERKYPAIRIFQEGEQIPHIPVNHISAMEVEAVWKKGELKYEVIYNSGLQSKRTICCYDQVQGELSISKTGVMEYKFNERLIENNGGGYVAAENGFTHPRYTFTGWSVNAVVDGRGYCLLADATLKPEKEYCADRDGARLVLKPDSTIPYIPLGCITEVVLKAVWEKSWKVKMKNFWMILMKKKRYWM